MTTLGPFHNPDNLTPEQIGTAEGWRLLRDGELIPSDAEEWYKHDREWMPSEHDQGETFCNRNGWNLTRRTRRPDPCSPSTASKPALSPMDSKWTRFSDATPTGPFYAWCRERGVDRTVGRYPDAFVNHGWTHWHPAPPLPEPPREETQLERDNDKINELILKADDMGGIKDLFRAMARSLLAWERAEVEKLLGDPIRGIPTHTDLLKTVAAIRARVGGGL